MTRSTWRAWQAATVDDLTPHTGGGTACELVGRSRATHHRQAHPKPKVFGPHLKPKHPAELAQAAEREQIPAEANSGRLRELSVGGPSVGVRARRGPVLVLGQRTMYRILAAAGPRRGTPPPSHPPAPGDPRTRRRGPQRRLVLGHHEAGRPVNWYHAYVVLDIFSRYALGWRVEAVEDGRLATDLIADIIATQGTPPGWLHAIGVQPR